MVKPKKHLGQHFLKDRNIASKIAGSLKGEGYDVLIEIGPGTGVLSEFLKASEKKLLLVEVDRESVEYLLNEGGFEEEQVLHNDFLKLGLEQVVSGPVGIIGNFPYNISSQIFFKILEHRKQVKEVVCMIQKEVGRRIASGPGSKSYGILSVLLQAFFDIKYLFTVPPGVFLPLPKVDSGVIRLERNNTDKLPCDEALFFKVVKLAFQTRRKTLRNGLKRLNLPAELTKDAVFDLRPEQLSVKDFITLTCRIDNAV